MRSSFHQARLLRSMARTLELNIEEEDTASKLETQQPFNSLPEELINI